MNTQHIIEDITKAVNNYRLIKDRIAALSAKGYRVEIRPMGPGGVFQVRQASGETRVQIGYGRGRWNYAPVVIL